MKRAVLAATTAAILGAVGTAHAHPSWKNFECWPPILDGTSVTHLRVNGSVLSLNKTCEIAGVVATAESNGYPVHEAKPYLKRDGFRIYMGGEWHFSWIDVGSTRQYMAYPLSGNRYGDSISTIVWQVHA